LCREKVHFYLPEYARWIEIKQDGTEALLFALPLDSGGTVRINVYRTSPTIFVLVDRVGAYRADLLARRVENLGDRHPPADGAFVGSFDDFGGLYIFVRAEERGEHPLE
jgi:hypothetical protein